MTELRRCKKCLLPETHESITFDDSGVCSVCRQVEFKKEKIDWAKRKKELGELIESYRGKYDYDCIVPFSGGKDSTWTLYYLMKEYKIKPLVVRFDHGFLRPNLNENTTRVLRNLGADFHTFTPNWKVVQKLMLQSFLEKGDFCWHCHTGIFSYPMHVAIRYNVPLIFWGEPTSEYTSYYGYDQDEEVDEKRFNRVTNLGITALDMAVRLGGTMDERDFKPYSYPPLKDLRKLQYRSLCLGSFIPWDVRTQSRIIQDELGWNGDLVENVPGQYNYEKIECYMQGVRDHIKYIKRGYTRPTHLASIDIRNERMTREEGFEMIDRYEGKEPPSLEIFLELVGLTKEEFYKIAESHAVSPWKFGSIAREIGDKLPDFDKWARSGKMETENAELQISNWKKSQ
ncbi:MAG: N-acetyl sugar amidotransferase [Cytophagales bacterium]|jgi:N-acetyl sugar amidotransferase|nr:N-acetyl sugar amidotransferase [Cytophagales bacterium]MCA6388882.1 N-acetyl sugar amidotransferase [Cytophagales bacterium]MCA6391112.1 N-acetyl sugar amidotransferase [Cytophagales bacterium]MCA6397743.1 N-acetyl sugar amidotransferase [Cytophagales bacterium]MCA6401422.1 N-acetyl sugar amidotransferase [Cytophagales bacterium]